MPIDRGATWAVIRTPSALAAAIRSRMARWSSGRSGSWATVIVIGRPDDSAMFRSTAHSSSMSRKSETTCSTPRPAAATPAAMPASSAADAVRLGSLLPGRGAVVQRAGGGEADRAGGHGVVGDGGHPDDLLRRGDRTGHGPFAHGVHPDRAVGHVGGAVDVVRDLLEDVEELGKGCPRPGEALVERGAGDVLDAFHEADEPVTVVGPDGGEAHTAVAEHDRGHSVVGGREQVRVPCGLPVVVGVDVDPPRCHQRPGGVDLIPALPGHRPDLDHPPVGDGQIGFTERCAGSVGQEPVPDHEVVCHGPSLG